jgi:hypothetical protein
MSLAAFLALPPARRAQAFEQAALIVPRTVCFYVHVRLSCQ